jgi:hypothetical protein
VPEVTVEKKRTNAQFIVDNCHSTGWFREIETGK